MGDRSTVLIRENETSLPARATPALGNQRDTLHMVFLSRVSPKKGLDVLLAALRNVSQPVTLDIYGPEEDVAYSARCHQIAESLPDHVLCRFKGPVPVAQVRETFAQYDLFVLPTAGENFGHVIAESLSVSCPVMCADTTPWSRLLAAGGGVVVPERSPLEWGRAIEAYALRGRSGWLEMRQSSTGAYDSWRAASKGPHIFEQLSQHLA
jgi:glycosyltransferase involved in cell wall biosynthesis